MNIFKMIPRVVGANSYILTADGKTAVVIDPSTKTVVEKVIEQGLQVQYVLLTHAHYDHVAVCETLQQMGAKVICSEQEKALVGTYADLHELFRAEAPNYTVDETMADGEVRNLCGMEFTAMFTPGHTVGSTTYLLRDKWKIRLFTGDTLLQGSIGRTDFPTGNMPDLTRSLRKLLKMEGIVHAGHGEDTTIERERKENPFLRGC